MELSFMKLFKRKQTKENKLLNDMKKFDYDTLQELVNAAEDKVIDVTLIDGTRLTIKPISEAKRRSPFGRFE